MSRPNQRNTELQKYLARADEERLRRHLQGEPGPGLAHFGDTISQLMGRIGFDTESHNRPSPSQCSARKEISKMEHLWQYSKGEWRKIQSPFPESKETDYNKIIQEWGYIPYNDPIGNKYALRLEIHEKDEEKDFNREWEFLLYITPAANYSYTILIDDLPVLLRFLREYLPLFELEAISTQLRTIAQAADRAYMAWHGHPSWDACHECDRTEQRRHEKRLR